MAFSSSTRSLFNLKLTKTHSSSLHHQPKKKPVILFSHAHFTPPLRSTYNDCFRANYGTFTNHSAPRLRFSVKVGSPDYSSGDEAQSLISEATQQEDFSWVSVIIPKHPPKTLPDEPLLHEAQMCGAFIMFTEFKYPADLCKMLATSCLTFKDPKNGGLCCTK